MSDNKAKHDRPKEQRVGFWRWVWRLSAIGFAACVVLLALAIGLFRVAVGFLPDYKYRIEAVATQAIGYPLKIGSIAARLRLAGPELVFDDVTIFSKDGTQTLLHTDRSRVSVDFTSLIKLGELRPDGVVLNGLTIDVQRAIDGTVFVQGIPLPGSDTMDTSNQWLHGWLLPDGRFGLRNVSLTYTDQRSDSAPIKIHDIDLFMHIAGKSLSVNGDAQLSEAAKSRVFFSVDAEGELQHNDLVNWQAYLKADKVDFSSLSIVLPSGYEVSSGEAANLSFWVGGQGAHVESANIDLDSHDVVLSGQSPDASAIFYDRISGRGVWESSDEQWQFIGQQIVLVHDGNQWPAGSVTISHRNDLDIDSRHTTFAMDYLNIADLFPFVQAIGLSELEESWKQYAPRGELSEVSGFVQFRANAIHDFKLVAGFNKLSLAPVDNIPGFDNVSGHVDGGYAQGHINIDSQKASLQLPEVLRKEVEVDELVVSADWVRGSDQFMQLNVGQFALKNSDIDLNGSLSFSKVEESDALEADIEIQVADIDLVNAKQYFPTPVISKQLLAWLDSALLAGRGKNGQFKLKGPLDKFPYKNIADGEFRAEIDLVNATLSFAEDWPQVKQVNSHLVFHRNTLSTLVDSARMMALKIENGEASLPGFDNPVISVSGEVSADLADMKSYLNATPVAKKLGQSWPNFAMSGPGDAAVKLVLPIKDLNKATYAVDMNFDGGTVQFKDWPQRLSQLYGQLNISPTRFTGNNLRGEFLGQPVDIQVASAGDAVETGSNTAIRQDTVLTFKGKTRGDLLAVHLLDKISEVVKGDAQWTAQTTLKANAAPGQPFMVRIQSPLEGMTVLLPKPLNKAAEQTRFLDASLSVYEDSHIETVMEYGGDTNIQASIFQETLPDRSLMWKVRRGEIRHGGGAAEMPASDRVRVVGSVEQLDISEILAFTERFDGDRPWLEINEVDLAVASLQGFGQDFATTNLRVLHGAQAWVVELEGEAVSGSLNIPLILGPETPITGDFSTLRWASTDDDDTDDLDPGKIPSMQLTAQQFSFNQYQLGSAVIHVEARDNIVALREFKTTAPGFETRSTGSWSFGNTENPSTYVLCELASSDVRATLKSLNIAEFMDSNEASAKLELSWPNGWTSDFLTTVEGTLSLNVGGGQLHSVDPGAGRVFGLLSIGALPRRLGLDFRDVFGAGFAFDSITGDFTLSDGNANTDNLFLQGPAANVGIVGRTGLVDRDYDQTAVVYANFGSSLPIAGALAGGPAVGAALLIFTEIFKSPLRQMGSVSYQISGDWDDPTIVKTGSAQPELQSDSEPLEQNSSDPAVIAEQEPELP